MNSIAALEKRANALEAEATEKEAELGRLDLALQIVRNTFGSQIGPFSPIRDGQLARFDVLELFTGVAGVKLYSDIIPGYT
jgi:hypothetical protein